MDTLMQEGKQHAIRFNFNQKLNLFAIDVLGYHFGKRIEVLFTKDIFDIGGRIIAKMHAHSQYLDRGAGNEYQPGYRIQPGHDRKALAAWMAQWEATQ